jgi:peptide-methionine (S)-S-oxide reductase
MIRKLCAFALLPLLATAGLAYGAGGSAPRRLPAPALQVADTPLSGLRTAVFSGGCFWGVQGVFSHVRGVRHATSGYAGGQASTASYEAVSTGETGHAESVAVTYDPKLVSYGELLRVFFSVALDPTEVDRQGPDEGSQYRSVVWAADAAQRREAEGYIRQLDAAHAFPAPIATRVETLHGFWPAEGYHQDFMARRPDYPYIQAWDAPKLAALKALYPALYDPRPVAAL